MHKVKGKVGFIGLGLMGEPMARHLLEAGYSLYIWSRKKNQSLDLIKRGAIYVGSPRELAEQVDVILLCLTDEYAVEEVLFGSDGVWSANRNGQVIVDHSTISPFAVKKISYKVKKLGAEYIDAPVTGSVNGAINGTLVVFAGGDARIIKKVKPVLLAYSRKINHMGGSGFGQITKICNQVMLINTIFTFFETINLAKKLGLNIKKLQLALEHSLVDSKVLSIFGRALTLKNPSKIAYIKDVMKDLQYIHFVARRTDSNIFLTRKTLGLLKDFIGDDGGYRDIIEAVQIYDKNK